MTFNIERRRRTGNPGVPEPWVDPGPEYTRDPGAYRIYFQKVITAIPTRDPEMTDFRGLAGPGGPGDPFER